MSTTVVDAPVQRPPHGAPSLPARLLELAEQRPRAIAYRVKQLGRWQEVTWAEHVAQVESIGRGLLALGVGSGDRVAILADNRPEWFVTDLAAQGVGAASVGVFVTAPTDEVSSLLQRANVRVAIAEDAEQLDKLLEVHGQTSLERIVVIDTRGISELDAPAMSFEALEASGNPDAVTLRSGDLGEWRQRVAALKADDIATVVFTPGTTGDPKGVLLSHGEVRAAAVAGVEAIGLGPDDEIVSALPLGEITERALAEFQAMHAGATVNFGEGGASFDNDLREAQPTVFVGVPRLWENLKATVDAGVRDAGFLKRRAVRATVRRGSGGDGRQLVRQRGPVISLLRLIVARPLRRHLGLSRLRVGLTGAATAPPELIRWWWSLGVPLREVYGLTETAGPATVTPADQVRPGTAGRAVTGMAVRIGDGGEVQLRGDAVFGAYLDDASSSAAAIADGWLRTGDLGELDDDGFLRVTGRNDDLVVTSDGRRVAPAPIEQKLEASRYVRTAVVVGAGRPRPGALLVIEAGSVGDWAASHDVAFTTFKSLTEQSEVRDLLATAVDEVNLTLDEQDHVACFALLPESPTHDDGSLTATYKLRRRPTEERLATVIDEMYADQTKRDAEGAT